MEEDNHDPLSDPSNIDSAGSSIVEDEVQDELQRWFIASLKVKDRAINPLRYWIDFRIDYPRVYRIAMDLYGVLAMSSECERVFSIAGRFIRLDRGSLGGDCVEITCCLRSWYLNGVIGT